MASTVAGTFHHYLISIEAFPHCIKKLAAFLTIVARESLTIFAASNYFLVRKRGFIIGCLWRWLRVWILDSFSVM